MRIARTNRNSQYYKPVEQTTHYGYDPFGRRLFKRDAFGVTRFVWDGNRLLAETRGGRTRTYLYEPGSFVPLAQAESNASPPANNAKDPPSTAQLYYFHKDHLGTPRELTDVDGNLRWAASYKVWGNVLRVEIADAIRETSAAVGARSVPSEILQPLRFQGQYYDSETGLHYNRFRYYDPDCGRFVSLDPIGLHGGDNLYQYAPNPASWIDPLGLAAHRGRLQAQGSSLEESVSWNQDTPLTAEDGKKKMEELKAKLSRRDLAARQEAFKKAEKFIETSRRCGGVDAPVSKTFMVKETKHERVDIEVISGKAFTD